MGLLAAWSGARAQSGEILRLRESLRAFTGRPGYSRDSAYIDTLDRLAYIFYGVNADSAFYYGRLALEYSDRAAYARGQAESWRILGNTYEMTGDYSNMLTAYHRSLDIAEESGSKGQIAKATSNIALFDEQQGEYDQARRLMEEVISTHGTLADSPLILTVYIHLAQYAVHERRFAPALAYAQRALQTAIAIRDEPQVATCRNEVGKIFAATGKVRDAVGLYEASLAYYRLANDQLGLVSTGSLLAQAFLQLRDYPMALQYALRSLDGAQALRRKPEARLSAQALADTYDAMGDDRRALRYFRLYKDYSDSLFNDSTNKRVLALAAGYAFEKQAALLRQEQAKREDHYRQALREDAIEIAVTALVIIALCLFAFVLLRSRNNNRRMNQLFQEKNSKI